jgi:hypothetical protein
MIFTIVVLAGLRVLTPPRVITCWAVKKAVAQYGVPAVESWTRANGVPDKEIEKAKQCLK